MGANSGVEAVAREILRDPWGVRRLYRTHDLVFSNLPGELRRDAGGLKVEIRWPEIAVRSAWAIPDAILRQTVSEEDIAWKLKPGRKPVGVIGVGGGGGRYGGKFGGKDPASWCGCPGGPRRGTRKPAKLSTERVVSAGLTAQYHGLDEIESVTVRLHAPIEEPFEIESPPLR
jgi:hypothetical protein